MTPPDLLLKIKDPNLNVAEMAKLAIQDPDIRVEIIRQMVSNPAIMIYYHCYYIVDEASRSRPDLFFEYWRELVPLLDHPNSYHRDIALTVLANLTQVDDHGLFSKIFNPYFQHLHDQKFMTALCCLRNSVKIIHNQPGLCAKIIDLLLHFEEQCDYPEKQRALFKGAIIDVLGAVFEFLSNEDRERAFSFVNNQFKSISPKTRQQAKVFLTKYQGRR